MEFFLCLLYKKLFLLLWMVAYGVTADFIDEYILIGEINAIESFKRFVKVVVSIFSNKYMRIPNKEDVARLLKEGEKHGYFGMLESIEYMHWKWKNRPVAWKGMYVGHIHEHL